jgi:myo-inositol-1-phosphate synthase
MSYNKSDGLFQVDIFKVNVGRVKILDKFDTGNRRIGAFIDDRMNRNYDGCTDEYSSSQNLLMEKENKL